MARERRRGGMFKPALAVAWAASAWIQGTAAAQVLQTSGFEECQSTAEIQVQKMDIRYDKSQGTVAFDVAGSSSKSQNVSAVLNVNAYGKSIYTNTFDPCAEASFIQQLCPAPAGDFAFSGTQEIPAKYADMVPSIAFEVPDISADATVQLQTSDGTDVACVTARVTNGKTISSKAVSIVAAGMAGTALVFGGVGSVGASMAGAGVGTSPLNPSFTDVIGLFQSIAMSGMMSVNYPDVYRSFTKNFAFSMGLPPWSSLQESIDNFRASTGGNLTGNSVAFLRDATASSSAKTRRDVLEALTRRANVASGIFPRQDANGTTDQGTAGNGTSVDTAVSGFKNFMQSVTIPTGNAFMTILLVVACVIAGLTVSMLLVKVILEAWARFGTLPESLSSFRKHYWRKIGNGITTLILLLYGIWVLYCMLQFTRGDSWAAMLLAGITLALFTGVLVFFVYKISQTAKMLRQAEGDSGGLYDKKNIWVKYSLFYESYQRRYWWAFVPFIAYMFIKGAALALGDGHGMAQAATQLVIEACMLVLLLWMRPFERRSGNVINIAIQVVRVLSVIVILIFVEEFHIAKTTQTVAGIVIIAVQSTLTGLLAILIAWNAINACVKKNPHRQRRKELEQARDASDTDTLTPLDARNSLLMHKSKLSLEKEEETIRMANLPREPSKILPPMPPFLHQAPSVESFSSNSTAVPIGVAVSDLSEPHYQQAYASGRAEGGGAGLISNAAPMGHAATPWHPLRLQPSLPQVAQRAQPQLQPQPQPQPPGSHFSYSSVYDTYQSQANNRVRQ